VKSRKAGTAPEWTLLCDGEHPAPRRLPSGARQVQGREWGVNADTWSQQFGKNLPKPRQRSTMREWGVNADTRSQQFGENPPKPRQRGTMRAGEAAGVVQRRSRVAAGEREFFIDNLLVRIHLIIVMIRWTGLAPWEFEFPFPGSLISTSLMVVTKSPLSAGHDTARVGSTGVPRS